MDPSSVAARIPAPAHERSRGATAAAAGWARNPPFGVVAWFGRRQATSLISPATARTHVGHLLMKLTARERAQLIITA
jgi:hypothetical protein